MRVMFRRCSIKRTITVRCIKCNKALRKVVEVEQTVNPFNKDELGNPKTEAQIREELPDMFREEADRIAGKAVCKVCRDGETL